MTLSPWTPERRARHSLAIRNWAPWKKSTGPRTIVGKAKSCMNAFKHGQYSRQAYEFRLALCHKMAYIKFICQKQKELLRFQRNELLRNRQGKKPIFKQIRLMPTQKSRILGDLNRLRW